MGRGMSEILPKPTDGSFESFEQAFRGRVAGCVRDCECGKTYWDAYNTGYSWDEGERERLEANHQGTALNYAVETIEFEGRVYVLDCDCWHQRAIRLIAFLRSHDTEIAEFLTEEKKRKTLEAERSSVVA